MLLSKLSQEQFEEYLKSVSTAKKEVLETLCNNDIKEYSDIDNVYNHGCVVGVSGFIYYCETECFFDKHVDDILEMVENIKQEIGSDIFDGFEITRNNLTWLFVEETVREFMEYVDTLEEE